MPSTSAPFGLRPAFHPSGLDRAQALANGIQAVSTSGNVSAGYATTILKGQPVKMDTGGYIVVAAAGVPHLLTGAMVKSGSAVLDVGITRTQAGLVGDVAPDVLDVAGFVAPMPGGVGPMTRAMLLTNVVEASERA